MTAHESLIYTKAEDGLSLEGASFTPPGHHHTTTIVYVHGLTGKFYARGTVTVSRALAARGYPVISGNNRGHDFGWPVADGHGGFHMYGGAWERLDEAPLDISAWIAMAAELGAKRVVLLGHSLGAIKVGFYQAQRQDARVVGLIAASPPIRPILPKPNLLAAAEQMVHHGRGRDLLPWGSHTAGGGALSADTYISRARVSDVYGAGSVDAPIARVRCPILAFYGTNEPNIGNQSDLDTIRHHARASARVETAIVPDADHSYTGVEANVANLIADWIDNLD